ncbi:selenide, water dikinase SelD [Veillonella sp. YH-vei2232]|uniref:Selenide, water dikinase n=1 Tax=Veillonella absiana TaxID=3079305 RepID=A0ABU3Z688_9FIRM|nr:MULTISPECIES: selenide, water dikinase SelD [unclassified Veillonella]MDV5063470.1 selenide, water dikinase SelD [Veillonella sp. YH-vei2232]MDV5087420.1 selenide, water dikinase SelD [Veillonella sp. YH-vei2233]
MVQLTKYANKGGCACKIGPHILDQVLKQVRSVTNDNVMVDMTGADDAGVYLINDEMALVQTLDFFTPIVDEPTLFGKIAAANSLSDVYAMGGVPLTAMNIVAFPVPLVKEGVLANVLNGAGDVLREAGVAVVGGHSIENEVPLFGLSVTGTVNPKGVWKNVGAQVGDVLVLTKPIGTGIMSTAMKGDIFHQGGQEAIESMCALNKLACEIARDFTIHSATDVTGFSLMGHGYEMARGSDVTLEIYAEGLPLFTDVIEAASMGLVPAATYGNRKAISGVHIDASLEAVWSDILFDPQTSGGLLLSVPESEGIALVDALQQAGVKAARIIGRVVEQGAHQIRVVR